MSARVCISNNPLSEYDTEVFKDSYRRYGDYDKAVSDVVKIIRSDWRLLSKQVRQEGGTLPKLKTKVVEETLPTIEVEEAIISQEDFDKAFTKQSNLEKLIDTYKNSGDKLQSYIMNVIEGALPSNLKVVYVTEENIDEVSGDNIKWRNGKLRGKYVADGNTNIVYINAIKAPTDATGLHELIHAASATAIINPVTQEGIEAKAELEALVDSLSYAPEGFYQDNPEVSKSQVSDVFELLARGLTEPAYQKFLSSVAGHTKDKSAWSTFVSSIQKLLGLGDIKGTAMEDLLLISERLFKDQGANTAPNINISLNDAVQATIAASDHPVFTSEQVLAEGNSLGWMKGMDWLRQAEIKFKPTQYLYQTARDLGLEMFTLQDLDDKARARGNKYVEEWTTRVRDRANKLVKDNPEEARLLKKLMNDATVSNKRPSELDSLSTDANILYDETQAMYKEMGRQEIVALKRNVSVLSDASTNKTKFEKFIKTLSDSIENDIYFPLQRFGDHRIETTMPDGSRYVQLVTGEQNYKKTIAELESLGHNIKREPGATGPISQAEAERDAPQTVMDGKTFALASSMMEEMGVPKDSPAQTALWQTFMRLQAKPTTNQAKRQQRRKAVSGASTDLLRGVETSIQSIFRETAKRYYKPEKDDVMAQAEIDLGNISDPIKQSRANEVLDDIKKRQSLNHRRAAWSSNASAINFMMYLGLNISSALINLTQNVIVGVPTLGARFGAIRSAKELSLALANHTKNIANPEQAWEGEYRKAFNKFKELGTIDLTEAGMHTQLADGEGGSNGSWSKFVHFVAIPFSQTERANRIASAMAAYKMAREDGMYPSDAIQYAHSVTRNIHGDYSEEGKSTLQRSDMGGVLLAFKSYSIQMTYLMINAFKKGLNNSNATEAERKRYRIQFAGVLAATFSFGGAMGMPLSSLLMLVFDSLLDDDEDAYAMVEEMFPDWVLRGPTNALTDVNLSSRTSLTNMFFEIPKGDAEFQDWYDNLVKGLVGPIGASINNIGRGLDLMNEGKTAAGIEKVMPKAYSNASKAFRWGMDGQSKNAYGDITEDVFDSKDAMLRLLGFQSEEGRKQSDSLWRDKRLNKEDKRKRRIVINEVAMAYEYGSAGDREDARKTLKEYNDKNEKKIKIGTTIRRARKRLRNKSAEGKERASVQ